MPPRKITYKKSRGLHVQNTFGLIAIKAVKISSTSAAPARESSGRPLRRAAKPTSSHGKAPPRCRWGPAVWGLRMVSDSGERFSEAVV